jgi:hypothetical protein
MLSASYPRNDFPPVAGENPQHLRVVLYHTDKLFLGFQQLLLSRARILHLKSNTDFRESDISAMVGRGLSEYPAVEASLSRTRTGSAIPDKEQTKPLRYIERTFWTLQTKVVIRMATRFTHIAGD